MSYKFLAIASVSLFFTTIPALAQLEMEVVDNHSNNPTAPYTTDNYDATTIFRCEVRNSVNNEPVTHSQNCPAGILRGDPGSASIRLMLPNGVERVFNFDGQDVTTPNGGDLTWAKQDDNWYIGIDNREFYIIPEAAIYGE